MRRRLTRALAALVGLFVVSAVLAWWSWLPGASSVAMPGAATPLPSAFRTWPEHDRIYVADEDPYVYTWIGETGAVCYFGVYHTADRSHPHLEALRERWRAFRPTVALCEGRARGHFVRWPFNRLPQHEPALVHELAWADGIPIWSLEPPYADEVAALLRDSTPTRVALYFTLRVYWSEAGGEADEALFLELLRKRSDVDGLRGALPDLAAADREWEPLRAEHGDWRTGREEPSGSWVAELSEVSRVARGEHMVRVLVDLAGRGERVLAVVGRSHVIRHEPVLQELLGASVVARQR